MTATGQAVRRTTRTWSVTSAVVPSGPVAVRRGDAARSTVQTAGSSAIPSATSCGPRVVGVRVLVPRPGRGRAVVDDQQPPARAQRVCGPAQGRRPVQFVRGVQVVGGDQVEPAVGALREGRVQVVLLGGHPVAQAERAGQGGEPLDRHGREVDGGDAPPPAREPQRVAALAAAQLQRVAGRQVGDRLGEPDVRAGVGGGGPGRVDAVPGRAGVGRVGGVHRGSSGRDVCCRGTRPVLPGPPRSARDLAVLAR